MAFIFPGQGAQFVGMANELCQSFRPATDLFDCASEILHYDLRKYCADGPVETLNTTVDLLNKR